MGKVIRYSEAFKLQVVQDLESGRFQSPHEAARAHGIGGMTTVTNWLRKYGRGDLLKKVVVVKKKDEPSEINRLKKRVRELEEAVSEAYMDSLLNRSFFEMLCEEMKIDPLAFKKKVAAERSEEPRKKRKRRKKKTKK